MYRFNQWKKEPQLESQADTYIERHFEESSLMLNNGHHIINEWRNRKNNYIAYTDTTIFDFQHYSRHDATHSVNILESIELMLGKDRIDKLSAGDLWLILESAYFHDIGMSLNYHDLVELWESEEFKTYLRTGLAQDDEDHRDAKNWYNQIDNLIHDRNKMEGIEKEKEIEFEDKWPVELERRLLFLVADYIRKQHPRRSERFLERFSCSHDTQIPKRLYQIVVSISISHGENFAYVLSELKEEAKGFGIDKVHPRFVAALLRLGDLLDMDNNRFNMRAVEHYGKLPWSSEVHLKKHKAMTHILISEKKISAEACSDDLRVCQITNSWFRYIDSETKNLISYWNEMAPEQLGGCIMQMAECTIFYPEKPIVFHSDLQKIFEIDKTKLTDLLIGNNIYDVSMDFLREYIQNALDATKMRIWLELKEGKYRELRNPAIDRIEELVPWDLSRKIYEDYAVELKVSMDRRTQQVTIEIVDQGIGMELGCIDAISKIGAGWRGRKQYNQEIPKMLKWLKPTGGFGIGVQSAFMVTDKIELLTKADSEVEARKITLTSPKTTGTITTESGYQNFQRGTSVKIKMDYRYFQEWNRRVWDGSHSEERTGEEGEKQEENTISRKNNVQDLIGELRFADSAGRDKDIFDSDNCLDYVLYFLKKYLEKIVVNSFIPIRITNDDRRTEVLRSPYLPEVDYWNAQNEFLTATSEIIGKENGKRYEEVRLVDGKWEYRCLYDMKTEAVLLWNVHEVVFTYVSGKKEKKNPDHVACFKNVCVVRNTDFYLPYASNFEMCIDFMGHSAEDALKVHRNAYNETLQIQTYLESSVRVFLKMLISFVKREIPGDATKVEKARQGYLKKQAKNLLYENFLPLICQLFFPDVDILGKYEPKDSDTIKVTKIVLREEEKEGEEKKIMINKVEEDVKIDFLLQQFKDFCDRKEGAAVFLQHHAELGKKINTRVTKYTNRRIADWIMYPENDQGNEKLYAILAKLKDWKYCVIAEPALLKAFDEKEGLDKSEFIFSQLYDEDESMYITMVTWKKEKEESHLPEKEFYRRAYFDTHRQRFIAGTPESDYHEILKVKHLPYDYDRKMGIRGPYLISPISESIRTALSLSTRRINETLKDIHYEKYEAAITEKDEYVALLQWVYENQIEDKKYKLQEIDEEYRKFINKIYHICGDEI